MLLLLKFPFFFLFVFYFDLSNSFSDTMLQSFRDELSALFSSITLNQAKLPDYKMDQQNLSSRWAV